MKAESLTDDELVVQWRAFRFDYAAVPGRELWEPYMTFLGQYEDRLFDILAAALKSGEKR